MDQGPAIFAWVMGFLTALMLGGFVATIVLLLELLNRLP